MIIRMWHGRVHHDNADAYREFLKDRAIPDYQSVKGNINVKILERREDDATHFITMTMWEKLEDIKWKRKAAQETLNALILSIEKTES